MQLSAIKYLNQLTALSTTKYCFPLFDQIQMGVEERN